MTIKINGTPVGPGHPAYLVAELSGNHNGDIERAIATIHAAADAGAIADAIAAALPHARSLPNLDGGAARVADALFARAARALSR